MFDFMFDLFISLRLMFDFMFNLIYSLRLMFDFMFNLIYSLRLMFDFMFDLFISLRLMFNWISLFFGWNFYLSSGGSSHVFWLNFLFSFWWLFCGCSRSATSCLSYQNFCLLRRLRLFAVKSVFVRHSACVRKVVVNVALLPLPTTLLSFASFLTHARRFQAAAFVMLLAEKAKTTPKAIACASTP